MSAPSKTKSRPPVVAVPEMPTETPRLPPTTTKECVDRIRALGQLVDSHVQFMCSVGKLSGASSEAKQKAATAFWERLKGLEHDLGQIREELFLG